MAYPARPRTPAWALILAGVGAGVALTTFVGMKLWRLMPRETPRTSSVLQARREARFVFSAPQLVVPGTLGLEEEQYARIGGALLPDRIGTDRVQELTLDGDRITLRTHAKDEAELARQREAIRTCLMEVLPEVRLVRAEMVQIRSEDLAAAKAVIEHRLQQTGVRGPVVSSSPPDRITVEALAASSLESERLVEVAASTGLLEFRAIPRAYAFAGEHSPEFSDTGEVTGFTAGDRTVPVEQVLAESPVIATSRDLKPNSRVLSTPHVQVSFEFVGAARDRFRDYTQGNVKRYLAIVLDGRMISCPVIRSVIPGEGVIEGGFDAPGGLEKARDLSVLLNAGPLPFDVECVARMWSVWGVP